MFVYFARQIILPVSGDVGVVFQFSLLSFQQETLFPW